MKTLHCIKTVVGCGALAIGLAGCGGGAEALVVPLFVFGFDNARNGGTPAATVFFVPDDPTTSTGTFDLVNVTVGGVFGRYGGNWSNCNFTIALPQGQTAQAPAATSYSGRFQGMDTIILTPSSGTGLATLTLQRQSGTLPRSFAC